MPLPRAVARANRHLLNPIVRRIAGKVPPFILIRHVGRTSGKPYETPIMAFRTADGFVIALTYGPGTDWQRNLEAAGHAVAVYRRRTWRIAEPRRVEGAPKDQPLPRIVQIALKLLGVRHFLYVTAQPTED
jgi:deazaflavin-dependent oxidoreductase (nitroreductase family)